MRGRGKDWKQWENWILLGRTAEELLTCGLSHEKLIRESPPEFLALRGSAKIQGPT